MIGRYTKQNYQQIPSGDKYALNLGTQTFESQDLWLHISVSAFLPSPSVWGFLPHILNQNFET